MILSLVFTLEKTIIDRTGNFLSGKNSTFTSRKIQSSYIFSDMFTKKTQLITFLMSITLNLLKYIVIIL